MDSSDKSDRLAFLERMRDNVFDSMYKAVCNPNGINGLQQVNPIFVDMLGVVHAATCRQIESLKNPVCVHVPRETLEWCVSELNAHADVPDAAYEVAARWADHFAVLLKRKDGE